MAGLPTPDKTPSKPAETTLDTAEKARPSSFMFEVAERIPTAEELNSAANPFQEKVNELARTGKAAQFVLPDDDVDWARGQIRRAAGNIGLGANTRFMAEKGRPGFSRIFFNTKAKTVRSRKGK